MVTNAYCQEEGWNQHRQYLKVSLESFFQGDLRLPPVCGGVVSYNRRVLRLLYIGFFDLRVFHGFSMAMSRNLNSGSYDWTSSRLENRAD